MTGTRERSCVHCGCTDSRACEGGCTWLSLNPPVCSACLLVVSVCVNIAQTGFEAGRVRAIEVEDVELESPYSVWSEQHPGNPKYSLSDDEKYVRIGRRKYRVYSHTTHYGNWCWDAIAMLRNDVRTLLADLTTRRGWDVTAAPVETNLLTRGAA